MVKVRISATVEKETVETLNSLLRGGKFRNKSHAIEKGIELLMEVEDDKNKK